MIPRVSIKLFCNSIQKEPEKNTGVETLFFKGNPMTGRVCEYKDTGYDWYFKDVAHKPERCIGDPAFGETTEYKCPDPTNGI